MPSILMGHVNSVSDTRVFRRWRRWAPLAGLLVMALAAPAPATAGWPRPAGGESASGNPEILFTFDDGPHLKHTPAILDELQRRHLGAIFFWVGWRLSQGDYIEQHRQLVRRAVREGHVVANHTQSHQNLCIIDERQAADEIDASRDALEEAAGMPMVLFRTPYGAYCSRLLRMLAERSIDHIHWDIDPQEWSHHNAKLTARSVTRKLANLEGRAILLLHDTHRVTVKALPLILDWIDEENARRAKTGDKPPIRVLDASEFLAERLDIRVLSWMADTAQGSAERLHTALARLTP